MRILTSLLLSGAVALALPTGATAQNQPAPGQSQEQTQKDQPALLVADKVFITPERVLVAEGNVEAFQGDVKITADRVTYNRDTGELALEGPVRIDQAGRDDNPRGFCGTG